MEQSQLFTKDLKDVAASFCALTEEEVESLYREVLSMSTPYKVRFTQLLAMRGDASRIMALHELGEPELTKICSRYLKTNNLRKVLYASFTNESTFIDLFNGLSETAKGLLLECLVWNKRREAGCLPDRLLDHPQLSLTSAQRQLLVSACSVQKYISHGSFDRVDRNAFFKRQKKQLAECAMRELYDRFKNGRLSDVDKYVPFLPHIWESVQIDGKAIRVCDLILDIWSAKCLSFDSFYSYDEFVGCFQNCGSNGVRLTEKRKSIDGLARYIISLAPLYVLHKYSLDRFVYTSRHAHYEKLLQRARLLNDDEVFDHVINVISKTPYPAGSWIENLDLYLPEEDVKRVVNAVMGNVIETISSWNVVTGVKDREYLDMVEKLSPVTEDEHYLLILDILSLFEAKFSERGYIPDRYFGLLQKEVPRDFSYHKTSEEVLANYPTVRQFERTLCAKGNTHICKAEASDRIEALNTLLNIACRSMDVRAVHRVLELVVGMVLPDPDLHLDSDRLSKIFSPDCLGLSAKSLLRSGSAEAAAFARKGIIALLEKSVPTEANEINILYRLVLTMYMYASVYSEYEEVYCEMMKPLIRLLVNDKVTWTGTTLRCQSLQEQRAQLLNVKLGNRGVRPEVMERMKPFCDLERYLRGDLESFHPVNHSYPSMERVENLPYDQVPPLSRRGLEVVLSFLEDMEEVSVFHVKALICSLINHTIFTNERIISKKNDIGVEPETGRTVRANHRLLIQSADMTMLRQLFTDRNLQWKGTHAGLSLMQTLFLTENTAAMNRFVQNLTSSSPEWETSIWMEDKESDHSKRRKRSSTASKKKKQEQQQQQQQRQEGGKTDENDLNGLFLALKRNGIARNAFTARYGTNMVNFRLRSTLRVQKLTLPQKVSVTDLPFDQESLKKCVDACKGCYLSRMILPSGHYSEEILASYIHLLTDENLLTLFSLGASYLRVAVHSALVAIYVNKKESIVDAMLSESLCLIPKVLFDQIRVTILVNRELALRGLHPEEKEIDLISPAAFLTRFFQSILSGSKQTIREMKMESLKEEKVEEKSTSTMEEEEKVEENSNSPREIKKEEKVEEKSTSTMEGRMEVEKEEEKSTSTMEVEEDEFEHIMFDVSNNDHLGRLVELLFFSRDIHAFFEKKCPKPVTKRVGRGWRQRQRQRRVTSIFQNTSSGKFPSVVRIARMMSIPVMLAICRRLMITTSFIPYADALLHIVLKSTNNAEVICSVVELLKETHHCITVALVSLFVRIASMPVMAAHSTQLKKLVRRMLTYATENKFQSVSVYFSILRFVISSILQDEEEPEEGFLKDIITTLVAVDTESEAGNMVYQVLMTFYAKLNNQSNNQSNYQSMLRTGSSSTCEEYVEVLNTLYKNAKEGRPEKVKALLRDVIMNFGLVPTNSNFAGYLVLLRKWRIAPLPESLLSQCVEIVEQPWRYYDNTTLYGAALSLLYTVNSVNAMESIRKGYQTMVILTDVKKSNEEKMEMAQIPKELEEIATKAIRANTSIPQILAKASGQSFPLFFSLSVWSGLGDLSEDLLPLSLFSKAVLTATDFGEYERTQDTSYSDVTVGVEVLATQVEAFAPWMIISLLHTSSVMQNFSSQTVRTILSLLENTDESRYATLLAIVLNKKDHWSTYSYVKSKEEMNVSQLWHPMKNRQLPKIAKIGKCHYKGIMRRHFTSLLLLTHSSRF